ncbi:hypothetical protein [Actinomycetospora chiangmaiensis]|uniref:hypothetical protein n=1 Tax=Actinomycetospora chiangmaiensis TaxID=402650 RepID=UPI0012FBC551|nr:hypothetical protein [Actinomycetospora chiangmaiensis]
MVDVAGEDGRAGGPSTRSAQDRFRCMPNGREDVEVDVEQVMPKVLGDGRSRMPVLERLRQPRGRNERHGVEWIDDRDLSGCSQR